MKTATVVLKLKSSVLGFEALVAPTEDGVFWLAGNSSGHNRAIWRVGEQVHVHYDPDDQFAFEEPNGN